MKWKTGRPNHRGWYIVRPVADRSDIKVRAYGQGRFWTPLIGGWMSSPEYEYQPGRIMPMAAPDSEEDPRDEWKRALTRAVELKRLPRTALTVGEGRDGT